MKILNIVLTILFVLFAVVQLNDPDPWVWVGIYLMIAVQTGMAIWQKYSFPVLLVSLAICFVKLGSLLPSFKDWLQQGAPSIVDSMKAEAPHIELTREFLGVLICIVVLLYLNSMWQKQREELG